MILKTKVYIGAGGYKKYENSYIPICDFIVNTYLFGFLINSVTVHDMHANRGRELYKGKIVYSKKEE